jgi:hypothetical protein
VQQTYAMVWSLVLMALPALAIVGAIRNARGTTLVAPLAWALLAYVVLNLSGIALRMNVGPDALKWIYIASVGTLCPTVALFGAKRPQNRAWQLIVLAFWFVLALPAIQSLLMHRGEPLDLHEIWKWFLAALILAGAINYLPTRYGIAALLVAASQVLLFWQHLPWLPRFPGEAAMLGLVPLFIGIAVAYWKTRTASKRLAPYHGWNRTWLDFRDFYGVVWALRVMERVNSLPASRESAIRLNWEGFFEVKQAVGNDSCKVVSDDLATPIGMGIGPASPEAVTPLDLGLRSLLRRFVSKQWLDARLQIEARHVE